MENWVDYSNPGPLPLPRQPQPAQPAQKKGLYPKRHGTGFLLSRAFLCHGNPQAKPLPELPQKLPDSVRGTEEPCPPFPAGSPFSQKTLSMFMTSRYQELPTLIRPTDMVLSVLTRAESIYRVTSAVLAAEIFMLTSA